MKDDILNFFALQQRIFGVCPECAEFFRLSECKIYSQEKPEPDWMDTIEQEAEKLEETEAEIKEQEKKLREAAREKGRRLAQRTVKKIDPVFTPRRLNPDDAKVVFHPIDYIVFDGVKADHPKNILLLDRETRGSASRALQRSIEKTVECGSYEWQTMRVHEDGKIEVE